ncbi:hypothetical protein PV328_000110 [Microctonus aethiopoides]|uniref:LanC-like protein 3 homolog n=1 Tax=Microctonus aethiopoides TaxID=144406 RepID=A0AA39FUS7_9HYME|nr:hypothetical protein PV328_000110 [Microctonus aethiopoides]
MLKHSRYFDNPYKLQSNDEEQIESDLKMLKKELIPGIVECITRSETPENTNSDGEIYVGMSGIAYAFYHASKNNSDCNEYYLQLAQRYLQPAIRELKKKRGNNQLSSGFLCGDAGIIAVAAVITASIGDTQQSDVLAKYYVELADVCRPVNFLRTGSDEFFVGRTGYIYGAIWLNKILGRPVVPLEIIHELGKATIISGKKYAAKNSSPCPLMYSYYGVEYLGAAHGLCSILKVLIQIPNFLDMNPEADSLVRRCLDYLLTLETPSANYPCALDEIGNNKRSEEDELVHWCHGAPGMIYLFANAYLRWQDQRYMDAIKRAGDLIWRKGLLRKGPGICHGIAGNGYAFLLLYRLTDDIIYLQRAAMFADFLRNDNFKSNANTPDEPYSLYEGLAGTLCFITDLDHPENATFPFYDVFL